jgi:hypothetical protein
MVRMQEDEDIGEKETVAKILDKLNPLGLTNR